MSYLQKLIEESGFTCTLNGAKTHVSSGDACLDFFAVAGGMRYRSEKNQVMLFEQAYLDNPDLAMKLLFHLRDIRGGMGERRLFRTLLKYVAFNWPESAQKNAQYIAEFGRWDDVLCLIDTPAESRAVRVIRDQLNKDLAALKSREEGNPNAEISLLAKWLPSDNASSRRTRRSALRLCKALGLSTREYRRKVTALRASIRLTECLLTRKEHGSVNYEAVPAQAMLKYRSAFKRNDPVRFSDYLKDVGSGTKAIHTQTLFPYEILRPYFVRNYYSSHISNSVDQVLEQLWNNLPGSVANINGISVVDTSGSMYMASRRTPLPALISQAMGLYCAERCKGIFHNHLITFESWPQLVKIRGNTLSQKLYNLQRLPWGGSTNLEAVFNLILWTARLENAAPEELPSVIYIFSDMEFNSCMSNADETVYENARRNFEEAGYEMPAVVFHNVNSWQMQVPVKSHTRGTALSSGSSTCTMEYSFDGNITPMQHMLRVLGSDRYAMIHA